jgi:hypothetical protein
MRVIRRNQFLCAIVALLTNAVATDRAGAFDSLFLKHENCQSLIVSGRTI